MGIREEIHAYIDGNGLVSNSIVLPGTQRASDNGVLFSSEYYAILNKSGQLTDKDKADFNSLISNCIDENGLLNRAPVGTDPDQEGPDDYYGTINGSFQTSNTSIPRKLLYGVVKNLGFLNNTNPGIKTLQSFLIRQPQLLCTMITAAFPSWINPLHILIRTLIMPLYWASGIVILFGAKAKPINDADSRILGWHLLQVVRHYSLFCLFASWIWTNRLHANYPDGMKDVATVYFGPEHPLAKYWIT